MTFQSNSGYHQYPVAAATANIKATPGRVFAIVASNRNAAIRYLQIFDSTGATTTIKRQYLIPAGSEIGVGENILDNAGLHLSTGITYGFSTTAGSYVAATASEHDISVRYR
jgi:hypothetical protein